MGQTKQVQRPHEVPRYPIFVICCEQIPEPEDVGRLCAGNRGALSTPAGSGAQGGQSKLPLEALMHCGRRPGGMFGVPQKGAC